MAENIVSAKDTSEDLEEEVGKRENPVYNQFKTNMFSRQDYRCKGYVRGSAETVQASIKEDGESVRVEVTSNRDIMLRDLDLKMQQVTAEREEKMAQKQIEREARMAAVAAARETRLSELEIERETKLAEISCDKEISLKTLDLTAVKKIELEEKKVDVMKQMHATQTDANLQVYSMDHKERMETMHLKAELLKQALNKKGLKGFSMKSSTFRLPKSRIPGASTSGTIGEEQLCLEEGETCSTNRALTFHKKNGLTAVVQTVDDLHNEFELEIDEHIEVDLQNQQMNHDLEMMKLQLEMEKKPNND